MSAAVREEVAIKDEGEEGDGEHRSQVGNRIWLSLGHLLGIQVSAGFQYLAFTRFSMIE